jgi:beta-lactamase class A
MIKKLLSVFVLSLYIFDVNAQTLTQNRISRIVKSVNGVVAVTILHLESRQKTSYNGDRHMVMHSVMKVPIAMTVLQLVDEGKWRLDQKIHIIKADLPETYSPLRDKYPEGNIDIAVSDLLSYMVSLSDNDACDILLKHLGGTVAVRNYLKQLGITGIMVKASEFEMASAWKVQYSNWCTANQVVKLLDMFYHGKALSESSTAYLMKLMLATSTGPKQLKGLLPAGTPVAHKTGRSPTNAAGLTPATNDVGIITLPNGKHLAVAVFIGESTASLSERERVIAEIARAGYDVAIGQN